MGSDFETRFGPLERIFRAAVVDLRIVALQSVLGPSLRFFSTRHINLLGPLGCLGKNRDLIRQDFDKSPGDCLSSQNSVCDCRLASNLGDIALGFSVRCTCLA